MTGNEVEKCLKSNIMDICFEPQNYRKDGDSEDEERIIIGNKQLEKLAKEYLRLRKLELKLTCRQRSFCHHEIDKIKILNGAATCPETLYADQIKLRSSHVRDHLIKSLRVK